MRQKVKWPPLFRSTGDVGTLASFGITDHLLLFTYTDHLRGAAIDFSAPTAELITLCFFEMRKGNKTFLHALLKWHALFCATSTFRVIRSPSIFTAPVCIFS